MAMRVSRRQFVCFKEVIKRLLLLGICALTLGASVRYFSTPTPAAANVVPDNGSPTLIPTGNGHLRWETVWTLPAPLLTDVALTPDGSSVVWVDKSGSIRRIDTPSRRTLWQTEPLPGVNTVCVAPQGTVLAYSRLNPGATSIRILDSTVGLRKSVLLPVQGAVWSAAITLDGTQAVVGTGKSLLYHFPLRQDVVFPGAPMDLPGIPEHIAVTGSSPGMQNGSNDPIVLLGTWQDGGVCAWGLDRQLKWRHKATAPDDTYKVIVSQNGSTAVAIAARGPRQESARLHVWDAPSGNLLFIEDLHGFAPHVAISANGQRIAVSYSRADGQEDGLAPHGSTNIERKVTLFDRDGRRRFDDKGGVFFSPELIGLSADGTRLTVCDPQGTLWTLDDRGRTTARLPLSDKAAKPSRVLTTPDGNYVLMYRSDGQLTLLHAVAA